MTKEQLIIKIRAAIFAYLDAHGEEKISTETLNELILTVAGDMGFTYGYTLQTDYLSLSLWRKQ